MNRKEFFRDFLVASGILIVLPSVFSTCKKEDPQPNEKKDNPNANGFTIDLNDSNYKSLLVDGGSIVLSANRILVFNTGNQNFMAVSSLCTHLNCTVGYDHLSSKVLCGCHQSKFNTDGTVISGPATLALKKYTVTKTDNTLLIK
jgi:cytochrome b6-f complex iron-sulfur subunit